MKRMYLLLILIVLTFIITCEDREWDNPHDEKSDLEADAWAPQNLAIQQTSLTTAILNWEQIEDVIEGFVIDKKIGYEEWIADYARLKLDSTMISEWADTNLIPDSTLLQQYRVKAYAHKEKSSEITTELRPIFPKPTNLQAEQLSDTLIRLTWQDNSNGEDGFWIDRKTGTSEWNVGYSILPANTTQWCDSLPVYGLKNEYRIYGYCRNVNSIKITISIINIIPTPSNLIASVIDDQSLRLTWTDNCGYELGLRIERNDGNGFAQIAEVDADVTTYTDEGLTYGQSYTYQVKVFTDKNESNYSNEIQVEMVIPAPTNLKGIIIDEQSVQIIWDDNCNFETGYKIERKEEGSTFAEIADLGSNRTSYTDQGLTYTILYTYRIIAYTEYNQSNPSNEFNAFGVPESFVFVPGGTFTMGDVWGGGNGDETPTHEVTLSGFYISKYEVTQKQYVDVMGRSDESWTLYYGVGDNYPAYYVMWYKAVEFCNKLSEQDGLTPCYTINGTSVTCDFSANGYRLPTEAEWEYAARSGGRDDRKWSGTNTESEMGNYAWYYYNSDKPHPVGTKQPNDLGIYDMSGNFWEWCWDWYSSSYYSSSPSSNPTGPSSGGHRVVRGGSYTQDTSDCRVANRATMDPASSSTNVGFRILRAF